MIERHQKQKRQQAPRESHVLQAISPVRPPPHGSAGAIMIPMTLRPLT